MTFYEWLATQFHDLESAKFWVNKFCLVDEQWIHSVHDGQLTPGANGSYRMTESSVCVAISSVLEGTDLVTNDYRYTKYGTELYRSIGNPKYAPAKKEVSWKH